LKANVEAVAETTLTSETRLEADNCRW